MAASKLNERHGISFRMTHPRDRFIHEELMSELNDRTTRSELARESLGLGLAAKRALDRYDIPATPEDEEDERQPITDVEAFVEEAVAREIERMGPGQIRELLG